MSDENKGDKKTGKPLTLRGGTETSRVRQSFSHGRTKSVVVEKKRKRVVVPGKPGTPGATTPSGVKNAPRPVGISDAEMDRRIKALEAAAAQESERQAREAAEAKEREEEREQRRSEIQEREREEQERQEAIATREQEDQDQEAATKKATEKPAKPAKAAEVEEDHAAAQVAAAKAESGKPVIRREKEQEEQRKTQRPTKGAGPGDRRSSGKLTITQALRGGEGGRQRSMASMKRKQERERRKMMGESQDREKVVRDVQVPEAITVQELANRMAERSAAVVKALMNNGIMATQNETIDADTAELIVEEFGHRVVRVSDADVEDAISSVEDKEEDLKSRAPVITIIVLTFLDTPGHAAFTSMRARGAQVTDIVVLVVAADDSVMPQTIEAINHAKAAGVPMIVAINKIDKPGADTTRVRTQLLQHEVVVEEMSGDVLDVEVSAKTGEGLDKLIDAIVLQPELLELKANPDRPAQGAVIEAKLDTGRGPVATVLVQTGTLKKGDIFVVGEQFGKVRALIDDQGQQVAEAGPSVPVEVLGLNGTPEAGAILNVVTSEAEAREIANYRAQAAKDKRAAVGAGTTLDQLLAKAKADKNVNELPIVVKADVQGSTEAIIQAMEKVGNEEVRVRVLHAGVGAITESDVTLAEASGAPIIGFNVRANAPARNAANQKGVEIRYYSIIYDLVDDVKAAASGLLSAEIKETFIGYATIKEVFKITGVGKIAGCEVTEGVARRDAGVRLLRDNVVIHEGKLKTLKRFKDEVKEVQGGQECGMAFENYDDIREGDVIEIFETEEIERTL
jgi:translation initiation factor IF-2